MGLGLLPGAPGTWGSLGALALWWWVLAAWPVWQQAVLVIAYFFSGWWCSTRIAVRYGIQDAGQIVADEIVGMWLALLLLPTNPWLALAAFVLFRVFDILKPGPIGWLDREVKGGLGVMLDDLVAGGVAGLLVALAWYLLTGEVLHFA